MALWIYKDDWNKHIEYDFTAWIPQSEIVVAHYIHTNVRVAYFNTWKPQMADSTKKLCRILLHTLRFTTRHSLIEASE